MKELYRQANKKVTTGGRGDATRRSRIPALSPEVYDFASTSGSMAVLEGFHRDPTGICRARRRDWWFTGQTSAVMAVTWGTGGWKGDRVRPWLSRGVFSKSEAEVSASAKGRGDAKVLKSSFRQLSEPVMERELVSECRAGYEAAQVPQGRESSGWLLSYRRRPLSWPAHPAARPLSPANGLVCLIYSCIMASGVVSTSAKTTRATHIWRNKRTPRLLRCGGTTNAEMATPRLDVMHTRQLLAPSSLSSSILPSPPFP